MPKVDPADLLTVKDIAAFANMPESTAYSLSRARHFPAPIIAKGNVNLWVRKNVEAFFVANPRPEMKKAK